MRTLTSRSIGALVVSALVSLAGCGGESTGPTADDPGIGHIHGVGMDPASGRIFFGAHFGVFEIEDRARVTRVAGKVQDTMAFTIVGPGTFLASGHPAVADIKSGMMPHLGLIRSEDAGKTWKTISAEGEADFHSLQPAGTSLYGYDSQTSQVWRSEDSGANWTRGAKVQLIDLAAHGERPARLYATTPKGVQVSDDSGTTFKPLAGAPALTHLDVVGDKLIGIDAAGKIQVGSAGGPWQGLGRVNGEIGAFSAFNESKLIAATHDGVVHRSDDGGRTFTDAYRAAE